MFNEQQRAEIERLWQRKVRQDADELPITERHRNLAPVSAEFLHALVVGMGAKSLLEIGGSSGISTIALASAARQTQGRLISLEIEPTRQAESKQTIARLQLDNFVDFRLADATSVLPQLSALEFVLIDCEKHDYIRFFDMLQMAPGCIVVADNVLSHQLVDYIGHVRSLPGVQSITLPVGQGLEISRISE